jgi:hypothetical protein
VFLPENGASQIQVRAVISDIAENRVEKTELLTIKPVQLSENVQPDSPVAAINFSNSSELSKTDNTTKSSHSDYPINSTNSTNSTLPAMNGSVPVTPPKPARIRPAKSVQQKSDTSNKSVAKDVTETTDSAETETLKTQQPIPILVSPEGKVAVAAVEMTNRTSSPVLVKNTLAEELLNNMEVFFEGGLPVEVSAIVKKPKSKITPQTDAAAANSTATSSASASTTSTSPVAGSIAGISLNNSSQKPQIIVKWNVGDPRWRDSQLDILRGTTQQGPWFPIVINLQNSGEYWWFLTHDDLKPFYIMLRIRSLHGGINTDVTQSPIAINPKQLGL